VSSTSATTAARQDDPRQTYLIIMDTLHSAFANFGRIRDALEKFFEKERSGSAQYALIALGQSAVVVQDSTRNVSTILGVIRSAGFSKHVLDAQAANLAKAADQFAALMRAYCYYCRCTSSGNDTELPQCPDAKSRVRAFLTSFGERTFLLNQQFLRELDKIVGVTATMPTSRTIVFISEGFNSFSGRELYAILMGYGPKDRSFEFNPRSTQPQLDAILKTATANNVKFYTIDSRGLYTVSAAGGSGFDASNSSHIQVQMDARGSPNIAAGVPGAVTSSAVSAARESTDGLAQLARETGGTFFENNNDLLKGIREAVDDGREYYVLSYIPDNSVLDGRYRKIQVTVNGGKWQVHAKAGYWASEK
jgi:VWFA-related protein